jgi:Flp pilus assembly protein TadD
MTDDEAYRVTIIDELNRFPNDPEVLVKAGSYFFEPGREPDKAVQLLRRALELDPRNTRARFWLAKCLFHDFCDYAEAEQVIRDSLQLDPNQPDALSLFDSVMSDLDRPAEDRIPVLRKAVELAPDWPLPRLALAMLLLESGRKSEAKAIALEGITPVTGHLPVPVTDPTSEYYEYAVTGRNSPECCAELKSIAESA